MSNREFSQSMSVLHEFKTGLEVSLVNRRAISTRQSAKKNLAFTDSYGALVWTRLLLGRHEPTEQGLLFLVE